MVVDHLKPMVAQCAQLFRLSNDCEYVLQKNLDPRLGWIYSNPAHRVFNKINAAWCSRVR